MNKLQFLVLIFAFLMSKLCNVLLCNYKNIFRQFFDSQDSGSPPYKMVENYKFELYVRRWGRICITVPNLNKIGQAVAEI